MAGFWENDEIINKGPTKKGNGFWENDEVVDLNDKPKTKPFNVFPLSEDEKGDISFDSNAGVFGAVKRAAGVANRAAPKWMGGQESFDPNNPQDFADAQALAGLAAPGPAPLSVRPSAVSRAMMLPKETPTTEQLLKAGGAGYDLARGQGVSYKPDAIGGLSNSLRKGLNEKGIASVNYPGSHAFLDTLEGLKENPSVSLTDLLAHRDALKNVKREAKATNTIRQGINNQIFSPKDASVLSGEAKEAGSIVKQADRNYAAGSRAEKLDKIESKAERRAGSANSGMNLDNQIRGKVSSLLENDKDIRGFSPEETASLENVANGNIVRNGVRRVGNMLGGGGGIGAGVVAGIGSHLFSGLGPEASALVATSLPVMGHMAKTTGNYLTERALQGANNQVRQRSPLYENAPLDPDALAKRYGLLRLLMSGDNEENLKSKSKNKSNPGLLYGLSPYET